MWQLVPLLLWNSWQGAEMVLGSLSPAEGRCAGFQVGLFSRSFGLASPTVRKSCSMGLRPGVLGGGRVELHLPGGVFPIAHQYSQTPRCCARLSVPASRTFPFPTIISHRCLSVFLRVNTFSYQFLIPVKTNCSLSVRPVRSLVSGIRPNQFFFLFSCFLGDSVV